MKIEGSALIKYSLGTLDLYIDEIRIHNLKDIFPPDFSILHDENGKIVFFESLVLREKVEVEKCIFIYKMGFGVKKYELLPDESASSDFIILQKIKYVFQQVGTHHKFNRVYFKDSKFIYEQVGGNRSSEYEICRISDRVEKYRENIYHLLSSITFCNLYSIFEFVLTDENINKLYFIFFNRKDTIVCYITNQYYHTFYNIFLLTDSIYDTVDICNRTNILQVDGEKIYLEKYSKLSVNIYNKLLLEIINNILLEHQVVLYSSSSNRIFNLIIFIINSIGPFNFNYYVNSNLHCKNIDLLEMPFPFLIGLTFIPPKIKNNIVFVNLDEGNIKNIFKTVLPFKHRLLRYLKDGRNEELFAKYFEVLKNNIDIRRENYLKEALLAENEEQIREIIYNPRNIFSSNMKMKFFTYFSNTQIFHEYLGRQISCKSTHSYSLTTNHYSNIKATDIHIDSAVYKIVLLIYPQSADDIFFTVKDNRDLLLAIFENIIFACSVAKNYKCIFSIYHFMIDCNISFRPEYFKAITFENNFISPVDLSKINIDILEIKNGSIHYKDKSMPIFKSEYVLCELLHSFNMNRQISRDDIYYNCIMYISLLKIDSLNRYKLPKVLIK